MTMINGMPLDVFKADATRTLKQLSEDLSRNTYSRLSLSTAYTAWNRIDIYSLSQFELDKCWTIIYDSFPKITAKTVSFRLNQGYIPDRYEKKISTLCEYFVILQNESRARIPANLKSSELTAEMLRERFAFFDKSARSDVKSFVGLRRFLNTVIHSCNEINIDLFITSDKQRMMKALDSDIPSIIYAANMSAEKQQAFRKVNKIKRDMGQVLSFFHEMQKTYPLSVSEKGSEAEKDSIGVSLQEYSFSNNDLQEVWEQLNSVFDELKTYELSEEDKHFIVEAVENYIPSALRVYDSFFIDSESPLKGKATEIVLGQMNLICSKFVEIRDKYLEAALESLSSQEAFLNKLVAL